PAPRQPGFFPLPLRASIASGSLVVVCVWLLRFSPWKFAVGFPGSPRERMFTSIVLLKTLQTVFEALIAWQTWVCDWLPIVLFPVLVWQSYSWAGFRWGARASPILQRMIVARQRVNCAWT